VRQQCATAGSFDTCLSVKMGDNYYAAKDACSGDGQLLYPPQGAPNGLECLPITIRDWFNSK
jgi:hypothetical protein